MVSPNVDDVVNNVREAAAVAEDSKDYLSYATVVDLNMGDPSKFDFLEAIKVLEALGDVLKKYPDIAYQIGWDIPELLLKYLETFYLEDRSEFQLYEDGAAVTRAISDIAYTLCEEANPKELFIKTCELLTDIASPPDEPGEAELAALGGEAEDESSNSSGEVTPRPGQPQTTDAPHDVDATDSGPGLGFAGHRTPIPISPDEGKVDMSKKGPNPPELEDLEFTASVRLYLLFNMLSYSMNRVKTAYPTRFFSTAASSLLAVASTRTGMPAISTILRRVFLLARDFQMDMSLASEEEREKIRIMLRAFLSHAVYLSLTNGSVKWSQSLYFELVNKVATKPFQVREKAYHRNLHTYRSVDALTRIAQLGLTFDIAAGEDFDEEVERVEALETSAQPSELKDSGDFEDDGEDEEDKGDDTDIDRLLKPSYPGLFILETHLHWHENRPKEPLKNTVQRTLHLYRTSRISTGLADAVLYWALWSSTTAQESDVQNLDKESFLLYLQTLMAIAATTKYKEDRDIAYSVVAKLLRLQKPSISYEFILDTLQNCPFDNVLDAVVQMLKMLILGKTRPGLPPTTDSLSNRMSELQIKKLELDNEQKQEIATIAQDLVEDVVGGDSPVDGYLLSWINFLTVVDVGVQPVKTILDSLDGYLEGVADSNASLVLKLATDSLRAKLDRS